MECKNCQHGEVCKWREKFETCQGCNDRIPIEGAPFYIESKCKQYKDKDINTCGKTFNFNVDKKSYFNNEGLGEPLKVTY